MRSNVLIPYMVAVALCVPLSHPLVAQEATQDGTREAQIHDVSIENGDSVQDNGSRLWNYAYSHPGSQYVKLSIGPVMLNNGDSLTVIDRDGAVIDVHLGPFRSSSAPEIIFVPGPGATLSLHAKSNATPHVTLDAIYYQNPALKPWKSIFNVSHIMNIGLFPNPGTVYNHRRAVVFMSFLKGEESKSCSGFLIKPDLVMTNDHCVNDAGTCASAAIIFDYEMDVKNGAIKMGDRRRCTRILAHDLGLDYSVFRLDTPAADEIEPLRLSTQDGSPGVPAAVIQHPAGQYKQGVEVGCQILSLGVNGTPSDQKKSVLSDFTHRCDTIGGSSGSPVIVDANDQKDTDCVIGLHHWGFIPGDGAFETLNRAVRMPFIVNDLQAKGISFGSCNIN